MTNSVELARRRLSTLMLYNVLRMNPHYDNRKMTSTSNDNNNNNNPWVQCFPTGKSYCCQPNELEHR